MIKKMFSSDVHDNDGVWGLDEIRKSIPGDCTVNDEQHYDKDNDDNDDVDDEDDDDCVNFERVRRVMRSIMIK